MAGTTWTPVTRLERKQWLLTNGEVVTEPPLETTPSGRKVRVAGTSLSAFSRDIDDLLTDSVESVAQSKGANIWMPLHNRAIAERASLGFNFATQAELHVVHDPGQRRAKTICWWRFKHPSLPIEAVLAITMEAGYQYQGRTQPQALVGRLITQSTVPHSSAEAEMTVTANSQFEGFFNRVTSYDERQKLVELVRSPPEWTAVLLSQQFTGERLGVRQLLKQVQVAESLSEITIPDLRDVSKPEWLTLELHDTNVTAGFVADMADYLDGTPAVEEAARLYKELQAVLRKVGVVMEDKVENDFQAALLTANKGPLTVSLGHPAAEAHMGGFDGTHELSVHLPTGTFVVTCAHTGTDHNQVAEKWEEALLVAQLTGEEDALLAYARKSAEKESKARVKRILKERGPDDDE